MKKYLYIILYCFPLLLGGSYGDPQPDGTYSVQGLWLLNGNANDSSGNDNHGSVNGATLATGRSGQAYHFDGSDDYIQVDDIDLSSGGSVFAWMQFDNLTSDHALIALNNELQFWMDYHSPCRFGLAVADGSWEIEYGDIEPDTSTWWWIGFTYSSGTNKIFVNGEQDGSDLNATLSNDSQDWRFGNFNTTNAKQHAGKIEEIIVWDRAMSAVEIRRVYAVSKGAYAIID